MTYRGTVSAGVVVLEGEPPADGTVVEVIPLPPRAPQAGADLRSHPAVGMWKDRADLPGDAGEAARVLGRRLMGRDDE